MSDGIKYFEELISAAAIDGAKEFAESVRERGFNLYDVLHMDKYVIMKSLGCDERIADFVRLTAAITSRRITDRFKHGRKYTKDEIRDYIAGLLFGEPVEVIYMLTFDAAGRLIGTEMVSEGTVNTSGVIPRKLLDSACRVNAAGVVLAHNHPRGNANASLADISFSYSLSRSFTAVGIELYASYAVAGLVMNDCMRDPRYIHMTEMVTDDGFNAGASILGSKNSLK